MKRCEACLKPLIFRGSQSFKCGHFMCTQCVTVHDWDACTCCRSCHLKSELALKMALELMSDILNLTNASDAEIMVIPARIANFSYEVNKNFEEQNFGGNLSHLDGAFGTDCESCNDTYTRPINQRTVIGLGGFGNDDSDMYMSKRWYRQSLRTPTLRARIDKLADETSCRLRNLVSI